MVTQNQSHADVEPVAIVFISMDLCLYSHMTYVYTYTTGIGSISVAVKLSSAFTGVNNWVI